MNRYLILAMALCAMCFSCSSDKQERQEHDSIPCCCGDAHPFISDDVSGGGFADDGYMLYGIAIRPDKSVSKKELRQLVKDMHKHKDMFLPSCDDMLVNVLSSRDLSKGFSPNGRIRADYLLKADTLWDGCSGEKDFYSWNPGYKKYLTDAMAKAKRNEENPSYHGISSDYYKDFLDLPIMVHENVVYITNKDICVPYRGHDEWGVLGLSFLGKKVSVVSTYRLKNKKDSWKLVAHEFNHSQGIPHCTSGDVHCIMQDANGHPKFHQEHHVCDQCKGKFKYS